MATKALLGGVELSVVTSEDVSRSNDITNRPTEKEDITDHVSTKPFQLDITGYGVPPKGGWEALQKLLKMFNKGELVKYVHRNSMNNVIIEKLDTSHHNKVDGGFQFSMSLKQVKIVSAKEIKDEAMSSQTSDIKNMGTQPVRSK